jgi:hypothetical protein
MNKYFYLIIALFFLVIVGSVNAVCVTPNGTNVVSAGSVQFCNGTYRFNSSGDISFTQGVSLFFSH